MRFLIAALAVAGLSLSGTAARAIMIDDAYIGAIYSQESFGTTPVDVRIGASRTLVAPEYVDLELERESSALFAAQDDGPAINLFVVDRIFSPLFGDGISAVTEFTPTAVDPRTGFPIGIWGNNIAFKRTDFTTPQAARVVAHELGHALGLYHEVGPPPVFRPTPNLMDPFASIDLLRADQVETILASPWMQGDDLSGFFVEVNVFDVVDTPSAIPLPGSVAAMLAALGVFGLLAAGRGRPS